MSPVRSGTSTSPAPSAAHDRTSSATAHIVYATRGFNPKRLTPLSASDIDLPLKFDTDQNVQPKSPSRSSRHSVDEDDRGRTRWPSSSRRTSRKLRKPAPIPTPDDKRSQQMLPPTPRPRLEPQKLSVGKRRTVRQCIAPVLSFTASTLFIYLIVFMAAIDRQPVQLKNTLLLEQYMQMAATAFPILYAGVLSFAITRYASLQLERGVELGYLEQLMQGTDLTASFAANVRLRVCDFTSALLAFLWLLSPAGSQACLRSVSIQTDDDNANLEVYQTSWRWLVVLCAATFAMLVAATMATFWSFCTTIPDVLGYTSTIVRYSTCFNFVKEGSTLSGSELARYHRHLMVQVGQIGLSDEEDDDLEKQASTPGVTSPRSISRHSATRSGTNRASIYSCAWDHPPHTVREHGRQSPTQRSPSQTQEFRVSSYSRDSTTFPLGRDGRDRSVSKEVRSRLRELNEIAYIGIAPAYMVKPLKKGKVYA